MKSVEKWDTSSTRFFFGRGCLEESDEWTKLPSRKKRAGGNAPHCVIVSDANVSVLYADSLREKLLKNGARASVIVLPPGEKTKTPRTAASLAERFARLGLARDGLVIALGGGVVSDVAGFAAAVYMRGVSWWALPTTLVGQIDAAIGGKTGVDLAAGKNLLGAFHQPERVVIDPALLASLSRRHFAAGLAEVVKYAFISGASMLKLLEAAAEEIGSRGGTALPDKIIYDCARFKCAVVEEDPYDRGRRRILNYGHTIAHALEAAADYKGLLHGEALYFGMLGAAMLGERAGTCSDKPLRLAEGLFQSFAARKKLPPLAVEDVMRHMESDKKKRGGELMFVLPAGIGRVTVKPVKRSLVRGVVREILEAYSTSI